MYIPFFLQKTETTESIVVQPGKEFCLTAPPTTPTSSLTVAWPEQIGSSDYCKCPICRTGGCNLRDCSCIANEMDTNVSVELREKSDNFEVCWLNVTYDMNGTRVYIWRESRSCSAEDQPPDMLFYITFEKAAIMIVGGKINIVDSIGFI